MNVAATVFRPLVAQNVFDAVNDWLRGVEGSLVNLISALAPWGAPAVPAWLSYWHLSQTLAFPWPVAVVTAVVVESLGLTTISTALDFWSHNRRFEKLEGKQAYKRAPLEWPIAAFVCYLVIILVLNVGLEVAQLPGMEWLRPYMRVFAVAFLTFLTVPGALILALRTQHASLLDEIEEERVKRRVARQEGRREAPAVVAPATPLGQPAERPTARQIVQGYRQRHPELEKINVREMAREEFSRINGRAPGPEEEQKFYEALRKAIQRERES